MRRGSSLVRFFGLCLAIGVGASADAAPCTKPVSFRIFKCCETVD